MGVPLENSKLKKQNRQMLHLKHLPVFISTVQIESSLEFKGKSKTEQENECGHTKQYVCCGIDPL